jgi:hypothetical protein
MLLLRHEHFVISLSAVLRHCSCYSAMMYVIKCKHVLQLFVGGPEEHDSVTKRPAHHLSIAVSQMWQGIMQHLPRWSGARSLLVRLLARRVAFAFRLHRQSFARRGHRCADGDRSLTSAASVLTRVTTGCSNGPGPLLHPVVVNFNFPTCGRM